MGAALGELQHAADHVIIGRRPVPAALQSPAVDDVAHQVKRVAFDQFQEIDKQLGIAAARAEMDVGYPDRPESQPWPLMRSEEHTSELQTHMRTSYAVVSLKKQT